MKKKKSFLRKKYNFGSGIQITGTTLAILILAGVLVYGGSQGWFAGSSKTKYITNQTIIEKLSLPPTGAPICTLSTDKSQYTVGETMAGTLKGPANTNCETYAFAGEAWIQFGYASTNSVGYATQSVVAETPGNYKIKAICGSCITNEAQFSIISAPSGTPPGTTCFDSDGRNEFVFGYVDYQGTRYYDECISSTQVKEQICFIGAFSDIRDDVTITCPTGYVCDLPTDKCVQSSGGSGGTDSDGDGITDELECENTLCPSRGYTYGGYAGECDGTYAGEDSNYFAEESLTCCCVWSNAAYSTCVNVCSGGNEYGYPYTDFETMWGDCETAGGFFRNDCCCFTS